MPRDLQELKEAIIEDIRATPRSLCKEIMRCASKNVQKKKVVVSKMSSEHQKMAPEVGESHIVIQRIVSSLFCY